MKQLIFVFLILPIVFLLTACTIVPDDETILGIVDDAFNTGESGANGDVLAFAVQSDGKILIGGNFTTYNGIDVPDYIIRLNENGSVDTTFNSGGAGANGDVRTLAVQSDGKILIGGSFTTYNGDATVSDRVIRLK